MAKILITRGAGFIGSHLVELFASHGTVNFYGTLERVS